MKTFRSTGIGNEEPFDEGKAAEWRRKKEATRRFLDERRRSGEGPDWPLQELPGGSTDDDAGSPDL